MTKTLLIIGAGREQIAAYEIAKNKGYSVVGTDMDSNAPAFEIADHQLIASTRDVTETLEVVSRFAKNNTIDGVMTIANDVPYTVSRVGEMLSLPCAPSDAVKLLTNKVEMKAAFVSCNVATPKSFVVHSLDMLMSEIDKIGYPAILKPSDGRGARGVLYIEEDQDLSWAYQHAMSFCDNKILILEEFVPGPQLSVEGMFVNGRYEAIAYADRNYSNLINTKPYIVEDGGCIPSHYEGDILEEIRKLIEDGALSLGLSWGTVKADIVLSSDMTPMIIELAGRLSGNYLATHHIPAAYGIDLVGNLIELCMGVEVKQKQLMPQYKRYFGVRYFFPPIGVIREINGLESAKSHQYTSMFEMYLKAGDEQPLIDCHGARGGTVMCQGESYQQATERVENLVKTIEFVL